MRQMGEHQRDGRGDQMLQPDPEAGRDRLVARGRQPAERRREHQDDDDRPEELRHRDAEIGGDRDGVVERTVVAQRRDHAEAHADDRDQDERGERQGERARESPPPASAQTGRFISIDWPKSPVREAAGPTPILQPDRIVEAELHFERLDLLGRRERARGSGAPRWRAGSSDGEHQHRHRDEHDER